MEYFSTIAAEFEQKYESDPDFHERFWIWSEILGQRATSGGRALDLGCGPGVMTFVLGSLGMDTLGIDAAEGMIARCQARKNESSARNVRFRRCDLRQFRELKSDPYDLVISSSVLEYVDDLEVVFRDVLESLSAGGVFVASFPNGAGIYRKIEKAIYAVTRRPAYYRHVKHVPKLSSISDLAARVGFEIVETRYYAHKPLVCRAMRGMGLAREWTENLFVVVLSRAPVRLPS